MAIIALKRDIHKILKEYKSVAILGASIKKERPAYYVPAYLKEHGYRIIAVNPVYAGSRVFGETILNSLSDVEEKIEIVDIFMRSEHLIAEINAILAIKPKIVWLQKGIRNDEFADELGKHGIDVVQNKCMLEEHKNMEKES